MKGMEMMLGTMIKALGLDPAQTMGQIESVVNGVEEIRASIIRQETLITAIAAKSGIVSSGDGKLVAVIDVSSNEEK